MFMYIYMYICKVSRGRPKGSFFSSCYTPRCRRGRHSFPGIASLYP